MALRAQGFKLLGRRRPIALPSCRGIPSQHLDSQLCTPQRLQSVLVHRSTAISDHPRRGYSSGLLDPSALKELSPLTQERQMGWKETSSGRYCRPIGEHERVLKDVGDLGHALEHEVGAINVASTFTAHGSLKNLDMRSALLDAWKQLRFTHPSIASYAIDKDTLAYDVPDAAALDEWAAQTYTVVTDITVEDYVFAIKPAMYMTLTYFAKTGQILLHTAHWRTDGIGTVMLLNALYDALAGKLDSSTLQWGQEVGRLTVSVEEAGEMPLTPSDADQDLAGKCLQSLGLAEGAVGIPFRGDMTTLPGGSRSARLQLSTEETQTVLQQCKARELSVTAAVHASIAAANYALAEAEHKQKHYTSSIRHNLRPYLKTYSSADFASALYTTHWMVQVPAASTWTERAQTYLEEYRKGISPEFLSAHREYAKMLDDLVLTAAANPPTENLPSEVDISSLGLLDGILQNEHGTKDRGLHVNDFALSIQILTRQCACMVWTFQGRLTLNMLFNDSFHETQQMMDFATEVKKTLLEEVGGD